MAYSTIVQANIYKITIRQIILVLFYNAKVVKTA
jgi:hypothetical protein